MKLKIKEKPFVILARYKLFALAIILHLILVPNVHFGQDIKQVTEEEVATERDYIDADLAFMLGDYDKAITSYKELYNADRSNHAAAYGMARSYAALEDIESAKKYIGVARKSQPDNKWYTLWYANYMRDMGQHEQALEAFSALNQAYPGDRYFAENEAYELLALGKPIEAIAVLDAYESLAGRQELITKKKFEIYDNLGNTEKALSELEALANLHKSNGRLWLNLAKYAEEVGNEDVAIKAMQKAHTLDPLNIEAKQLHNRLVGSASTTNDDLLVLLRDRTGSVTNKVVAVMPMVNQLAQGSLTEADAVNLMAYGQAIREAHPGSAPALALHADILLHSNKYVEAADLYKQAIAIDDGLFSLYDNLLYALLRTDQTEELLKYGAESLDYFPNEVNAYYYYSRALSISDASQEARSIAQEGRLVAGGRTSLVRLLNVAMAYSYMAENNTTKADEILQNLNLNDGWVQEALGDLALQLGKSTVAKKHYKMAGELLHEPLLLQKAQ